MIYIVLLPERRNRTYEKVIENMLVTLKEKGTNLVIMMENISNAELVGFEFIELVSRRVSEKLEVIHVSPPRNPNS